MIKIALFASGNGSNAQRISDYFAGSDKIKTELILTNNPGAFVIERARLLNIPCIIFTREEFCCTNKIVGLLKDHDIAYIILAGFLWMVPENILENWQGKIINIHPALLPKYGGKGMYGMKVHQSVIEAGETESGITIHHVNEHYDEGQIIFQAKCEVLPGETSEQLAKKIHQLEYEFFPKVIEEEILSL